jgi:hypothetical protein
MRSMRLLCAITACLSLDFLMNAPATAAPPRVILAAPDHADADVDPAISEIRIEFDQDMSHGGHSICGGGPTFPKIRAKPTWIDARTIRIPVELESGHEYSLSINCPAAQNFRSTTGEAAEMYPILFRTAKAGEPPPAAPTPEQNRAAMAALRKAIHDHYSYRDLREVDWQKRFEEFENQLENSRSAAQFARTTAQLLRSAADPHISILVNGFTLGTRRDFGAPANFNGRLLGTIVEDLREHNECVVTGRLEGGVPYLLIATWGPSAPSKLEPAFEFIARHTDANALVLDVRPNGGGDESLAQQIAGCFIDQPAVYSRNRYRDPAAPDGFGKVLDRVVRPNTERTAFKGRVAVLMGPRNMSSNESFLLMMRQSPRCKLIGARSFGSSGNPRPHALGNGVTVLLPSWQDMLPDGALLEGRGIEPDVRVETDPGDFTQRDPVIDAALRELKK